MDYFGPGEELMLGLGNDEDTGLFEQDESISDSSSRHDGENPFDEIFPEDGIIENTTTKILQSVRNAIAHKSNLLVECPPGLDRRMNILQGTLEYFRWRKGLTGETFDGDNADVPNPSRIYLGVPNFSDIQRVLTEIQHRPETRVHLKDLKIAILGPKKHLCVNDEVLRMDVNVEGRCSQLVKNYQLEMERGGQQGAPLEVCDFYPNSVENDQLFSFTEDNPELEGDLLVRDIEDLKLHSKEECRRCPFYDSQIMHRGADLIMCPIEYLLSPVLRAENGVELQNSIVIIDEGHDLEARCFAEGTAKITSSDLIKASTVLQRIVSHYRQIPEQNWQGVTRRVVQRFANLVQPLRELSGYVQSNADMEHRPKKEEILERLISLNITNCTDMCQALVDVPTRGVRIDLEDYEILPKLKQFFTVLCTAQNCEDDYSMQILKDEDEDNNLRRYLYILCAGASVLLGHVERPALSLILGGDCLAPINCLKKALKVDFHITLQEIYPLTEIESARRRYFLGYCGKGPTEKDLGLDYYLRGDVDIKLEVGQAILALCRVIPQGVVVLFHSEKYFRVVLQALRQQEIDGGDETILAQLKSIKHIIKMLDVPAHEEEIRLNRYRQLCSESQNGTQNGAVLLAFARCRIWKNCYLSGEETRGIINVSMPFGTWYDLTFAARREYLKREAVANDTDPKETPLEWYRSEAFRVLNQSFSRCVRSNDDWGVAVVLDTRMEAKRHEFRDRYLPAWVNNLQMLQQFEFSDLVERIRRFTSQQHPAGGNVNV